MGKTEKLVGNCFGFSEKVEIFQSNASNKFESLSEEAIGSQHKLLLGIKLSERLMLYQKHTFLVGLLLL